MEALSFCKTAQKFRGVTFDRVNEICGEFLWGFEYALTKGKLSIKFLRSMASREELKKIDELLKALAKARAEREVEAQAYLEKRKAAKNRT